MRSKSHMKSPTRRESREIQTLIDEESSYLPEEIIVEILLKLPVKPLSKFKCVSKSWLYLISSQKFIKTHTRASKESSNLNYERVIFTINDSTSDLMQCSIHSLLCGQPLADTLNFDYPTKHPPQYVWIVGSCDGLICIAVDKRDFILWNPSTKKSKKVPSMDPELYIGRYGACGFGFDESNDDYNIVGIFSEEGRYKKIMMVYGLRSDSWNRVGDLEGGSPLTKEIKFVCGKLHWLVGNGIGPDFWWDIDCLDLESGVYGTVEQPDRMVDALECSLGVIGGCICFLRYDVGYNVNLWILKEYGVKESWSKVFQLDDIPYAERFVLMKPLCLLPNDEILLVCGSSFFICNPRCDSFRVVKATNLDRFLEMDIFVETLVSPGAE